MNLNKILTGLAASAVFALAAGSAQAATYQFTITGDYTASFQLQSTLLADDGFSGEGFNLNDVAGTYAGAVSNLADLAFFNDAIGGGLEIDDYIGGGTVLLSTDGPQLYTGDEEGDITFSLGSFALTEYQGTGSYTLTVTDASAAAVPEPASIAMLLAGIGMVGTVARRRRNGQAAAL